MERVLAAQAPDGSWPIEAWFTGVATRDPWGSQAISIALCLEALKEAIASAEASAKEIKMTLPASGAIDKGEAYLLDRIRARQLVSRAPDNPPDKRVDDCGEAFLAIDALIAVDDRVEASDRRKLAARLLASRSGGAWNYSGRGGVNADTTASAIRAWTGWEKASHWTACDCSTIRAFGCSTHLRPRAIWICNCPRKARTNISARIHV